MIWKASLVLSLVICVLSDKRPAISGQKIKLFLGHHGDLSHIGHNEPDHHDIYAWAYPSYEFLYHVDDPHTHDMKGQHEIRDGDKVTGNYWLIQPDGHKRTVKYSSDHKNGFHAEVHYQAHDGNHYEVKEHQGNENHQSEYGWNHICQHRERIRIDEKRDGDWRRRDDKNKKHNHFDRRDHDARREHGDNDEKRDHDERRSHDVKRGFDDKRSRDHERQHGREDHLWAWMKARKEHRDKYRQNHKDSSGDSRLAHGHKEHWKHGVLVGWTEGRDRDSNHKDGDNYYRDNRHRGKDNQHRPQRDDSYEDRRGQHSYHAPKMNYKPLVPYGQRLN